MFLRHADPDFEMRARRIGGTETWTPLKGA